MAGIPEIVLDSSSQTPLYRQLADSIGAAIRSGSILVGEKLPPTRELAGQLGVNRTTVSAAYALLEQWRLINAQVGRGSFVAASVTAAESAAPNGFDWNVLLPPPRTPPSSSARNISISFASSHPAPHEFPLAEFRQLARKVIDGDRASDILQLGSSHGYPPLRRYLLERAMAQGTAGPGDDLLVTNGCQQALDLLARVFVRPGTQVAVEDPVYHGLLRVFGRAGAELVPVPVDDSGVDPEALASTLERCRPKLLVLTPTFQNPTGATLSSERRVRLLQLAQRAGCAVVENDIYSELRYTGEAVPRMKELDASKNTILLRSYSKVAFPGLRVGWVVAPRAVVSRMAEAKEISDLHSDHLSQAVLLEFAESGELERHLQRTRENGKLRLETVLEACDAYLPSGTRWTRPEGGMSLWVELPDGITAQRLLARSEEMGVTFLPGHQFSASKTHAHGFRISFGGLPLHDITRGLRVIGEVARMELNGASGVDRFEPATALV